MLPKKSLFVGNCDAKEEIRVQIDQARQYFSKIKEFFTRSVPSLQLRARKLICCMFATLVYGCGAWMVNQTIGEKD